MMFKFYLFISLFFIRVTAYANSNMKGFLRLCQNPQNSETLQHTFKELRAITATVNCEASWQRLASMQSLVLKNRGLQDLTPLRFLTQLSKLNVSFNRLSELSALAHLGHLRVLDASHNQLASGKWLRSLGQIGRLNIANNQLTDLEFLATWQQLIELDASHNRLTGLEPLSGLKTLLRLNAAHNQIGSLLPLQSLRSLQYLDLSFNQLTYLDALASLDKLVVLGLQQNAIHELRPLAKLEQLRVLKASGNRIASIEALYFLDKLEKLDLSDNQIRELSPLGHSQSLLHLRLAGNHIREISPLKNVKSLKSLSINANPLADQQAPTQLKNIAILHQSINKRLPTAKEGQTKESAIFKRSMVAMPQEVWSFSDEFSPLFFFLLGLYAVCLWRLFKKSSVPGWLALIPFYNFFILTKIINKPPWWGLALILNILDPFLLRFLPQQLTSPLLPLAINIAVGSFYFLFLNALRKKFDRSLGFTLGLFFLPVIFYPLLAFSEKLSFKKQASHS